MLDGNQNNDSERPGIEESYSSATNTSNLSVEARRRMPADTVIAAGWSRSRLGAALLRLHSEWDGAEKKAKLTEEEVRDLAASLQVDPATFDADPEVGPLPVPARPNTKAGLVREFDGKRNRYRQPMAVAREKAARWHQHELGLLFQKLKTLPYVREHLIAWCSEEGIQGGREKVAEVLSWWLNPTCGTCDGQKWQVIAGTGGRHSNRVCADCNGSGEADLPFLHEGRKMLGYINDCLSAARDSMQGRFRHQKPKEG